MDELDFLKRKEVIEFILDNVNTNVNTLLLNPPKEFKDGIKQIADQIQSRRKAKGKLDHWVDNPNILFPPPLSIEQASSFTTAEYKQSLVDGQNLIDLTGGTGIDCIHLAQKFDKTVYVEKDSWLCKVFKKNAKSLDLSIEVVQKEASEYLTNFNEKATFFLDPARRNDLKNKVFKLEDCSPNLLEILPFLNKKGERILVKLSPLLDIKAVLNAVDAVKEIHIVSVRNDCKELILVIEPHFIGPPELIAVNLETNQKDFRFRIANELSVSIEYGNLKKYLYEPNASILKAGSFNLPANKFNLSKLSSNTHLYTADEIVHDFPGKIFEVIDEANKSTIKQYSSKGHLNVMTRNYPIKATELKKKYRINDGGAHFLIGFRDASNKSKLVIAKRLDQ